MPSGQKQRMCKSDATVPRDHRGVRCTGKRGVPEGIRHMWATDLFQFCPVSISFHFLGAPNDGRVPTTHRAEHTRTEHTRSTYEYSKRDRDLEEMIRSYGRVRRPNWTRNPQQARVRESNGSDEPRDGQFDRPLHRYSKEFEFKNVYVHPTERGKRPLGQEKRNENITNVVFWSTLFLIVTVCILRFK